MEVLVRFKGERHKVCLPSDATLGDLKQEISVFTDIPFHLQSLKTGYPPRLIRIPSSQADEMSMKLTDVGIQSKDVVIVEHKSSSSQASPVSSSCCSSSLQPLSPPESKSLSSSVGKSPSSSSASSNSLAGDGGRPSSPGVTGDVPPVRSSQASRGGSPSSSASSSYPETHAGASSIGEKHSSSAASRSSAPRNSPTSSSLFGGKSSCYPQTSSLHSPSSAATANGKPREGGGEGRGGARLTVSNAARSQGRVESVENPRSGNMAREGSGVYNRGGGGGQSEGGGSEDENVSSNGFSQGRPSFSASSSGYLRDGGSAAAGQPSVSAQGRPSARDFEEEEELSSHSSSSLFPVADPRAVGDLFRYVVPSDNSCLFTCLSMLAAPGKSPQSLRDLVGKAILYDPESYTDAILERPRQEYIQWITSPTSWGGYVELAILSSQLQHEIIVIDIETKRKDVYGDSKTGRRIYLLYDGVHYDAIIGQSRYHHDPRFRDVYFRVFSPSDSLTEQKAVALAAEFHQKRQFVNLNEMKFQCLVCGVSIKDQAAVKAHAKETGHANYGENKR